jgi:hypothetical protein
MSSSCNFCKTGHVDKRRESIAFRQQTTKGYVRCRVVIPVAVCECCGSREWDEAAEAIIEDAVRQEYEKLPAQEASAAM